MDYGALINALAAQKTPMQTFMDSMKQGAQQRNEEAQAQYHQGLLANEQQKLSQEKEFEPLRLDLLKAQVEASKRGGFGGLGATAKDENFFQTLVAKDNPAFANDAQKVYEASNLIRQGIYNFPGGETINPLSPAASIAWNKQVLHSNTAAGLNQQRFAVTLDSLFKAANENANDAFTFSGVGGTGENWIDSAKSQFGENSKEYLNYRKFTEEDVPAIVTEIVRTSGAHSTDSQKAMALQAALVTNIHSHPDVARAKWEELQKLYGIVAKSIAGGPAQIQQKINQPQGSQPGNIQAPPSSVPESPGITKVMGGKTYKMINGSWHVKKG